MVMMVKVKVEMLKKTPGNGVKNLGKGDYSKERLDPQEIKNYPVRTIFSNNFDVEEELYKGMPFDIEEMLPVKSDDANHGNPPLTPMYGDHSYQLGDVNHVPTIIPLAKPEPDSEDE